MIEAARMRTIMAMTLTVLMGPFLGSMVGGILTVGVFTNFTLGFSSGFDFLFSLRYITGAAALFAYPITLLLGVPVVLVWERYFGEEELWLIPVIGGMLGAAGLPLGFLVYSLLDGDGGIDLGSTLLAMVIGIVPGAITASITAFIYFRTKACLETAGDKTIWHAAFAGTITGAAIGYLMKYFVEIAGFSTPFGYHYEILGALCGYITASLWMKHYLKIMSGDKEGENESAP